MLIQGTPGELDPPPLQIAREIPRGMSQADKSARPCRTVRWHEVKQEDVRPNLATFPFRTHSLPTHPACAQQLRKDNHTACHYGRCCAIRAATIDTSPSAVFTTISFLLLHFARSRPHKKKRPQKGKALKPRIEASGKSSHSNRLLRPRQAAHTAGKYSETASRQTNMISPRPPIPVPFRYP